eukprot:Awhi_evm2s12468
MSHHDDHLSAVSILSNQFKPSFQSKSTKSFTINYSHTSTGPPKPQPEEKINKKSNGEDHNSDHEFDNTERDKSRPNYHQDYDNKNKYQSNEHTHDDKEQTSGPRNIYHRTTVPPEQQIERIRSCPENAPVTFYRQSSDGCSPRSALVYLSRSDSNLCNDYPGDERVAYEYADSAQNGLHYKKTSTAYSQEERILEKQQFVENREHRYTNEINRSPRNLRYQAHGHSSQGRTEVSRIDNRKGHYNDTITVENDVRAASTSGYANQHSYHGADATEYPHQPNIQQQISEQRQLQEKTGYSQEHPYRREDREQQQKIEYYDTSYYTNYPDRNDQGPLYHKDRVNERQMNQNPHQNEFQQYQPVKPKYEPYYEKEHVENNDGRNHIVHESKTNASYRHYGHEEPSSISHSRSFHPSPPRNEAQPKHTEYKLYQDSYHHHHPHLDSHQQHQQHQRTNYNRQQQIQQLKYQHTYSQRYHELQHQSDNGQQQPYHSDHRQNQEQQQRRQLQHTLQNEQTSPLIKQEARLRKNRPPTLQLQPQTPPINRKHHPYHRSNYTQIKPSSAYSGAHSVSPPNTFLYEKQNAEDDLNTASSRSLMDKMKDGPKFHQFNGSPNNTPLTPGVSSTPGTPSSLIAVSPTTWKQYCGFATTAKRFEAVKDKKHVCPECQRTYASVNALGNHKRRKHNIFKLGRRTTSITVSTPTTPSTVTASPPPTEPLELEKKTN